MKQVYVRPGKLCPGCGDPIHFNRRGWRCSCGRNWEPVMLQCPPDPPHPPSPAELACQAADLVIIRELRSPLWRVSVRHKDGSVWDRGHTEAAARKLALEQAEIMGDHNPDEVIEVWLQDPSGKEMGYWRDPHLAALGYYRGQFRNAERR